MRGFRKVVCCSGFKLLKTKPQKYIKNCGCVNIRGSGLLFYLLLGLGRDCVSKWLVRVDNSGASNPLPQTLPPQKSIFPVYYNIPEWGEFDTRGTVGAFKFLSPKP